MNIKLVLCVLCFGVIAAGASAVAPSYDELIVAADDNIQIVRGNSSKKLLLQNYAGTPMGLAYNPSSRLLYFSDRFHSENHIFSTSLNATDLKLEVQPIVAKHDKQAVSNLAFDPVDNSVMWVDEKYGNIKRIQLEAATSNSTDESEVELIHFLGEDKPRGFVADPCTRMLYWTNFDKKSPSIERSHMNGSQREIIVDNDIAMPHGLALDVKEQKIYWVNNFAYTNFRIERSYVDGSERQPIYVGISHYIFGLAVSDDYIYWTDWEDLALFVLPKNGAGEPKALRYFSGRPMAVILFQQQPISCDTLAQITHDDGALAVDSNAQVVALSATVTANAHEQTVYKTVDELAATETSTSKRNPCIGYCFNDGHCNRTESDQLICRCPGEFTGYRCEIKGTWTMPSISSLSEMKRQLSVALICSGVTCGALLVVVIALSIRVHRLSRRPRLRRRFFGPKIGKSGKLGSSASSEPVMDIENCCNMNICETPCTEPPSRTPKMDKKDRSDSQKLLSCEF